MYAGKNSNEPIMKLRTFIALSTSSLLLHSPQAHAVTCDMAAQEEMAYAAIENGNAIDLVDSDFDCANNDTDNCPGVPNPDQADQNHNGTGDACEDSDGDGLMDWEELSNEVFNPDLVTPPAPWRFIVSKVATPPKNSKTGKVCAQIATHTDPNNADTDGDGLSDFCELWFPNEADPVNADSDCDGKSDGAEFGVAAGKIVKGCAQTAPKILIDGQLVNDLILIFGDSSGDAAGSGGKNPAKSNPNDADSDDDGILDGSDNCPILANKDQADTNKNGIGDVCQVTCKNGSLADAYGRCSVMCNDGKPADSFGICSCASLGKVKNNAGYCIDPKNGTVVSNEPPDIDGGSAAAGTSGGDSGGSNGGSALFCPNGTANDGSCVRNASKCNANQLLFGETTCCDPRTEIFDADTLTCHSKSKDITTPEPSPTPTTSATGSTAATGCSLILDD